MVEDIRIIVYIITSIIGTVGTFIKTDLKRNKERERDYYQYVLVPFIKAYKKNREMNSIAFLEPIIRKHSECVPAYIEYLLTKQKSEDINMVLQCDYLEFYKNDENKMLESLRVVKKKIHIMVYILAVFLLFIAGFYIVEGILVIVSNLLGGISIFDGIKSVLKGFFAGFTSTIVMYILLFLSKDPNTLRVDKMEYLINKKIKYFRKNEKKYFI